MKNLSQIIIIAAIFSFTATQANAGETTGTIKWEDSVPNIVKAANETRRKLSRGDKDGNGEVSSGG
ncbi:MAG: hypothetical protein ACI8P9_004042 [Parasphingorhabdus sp.]|jgi:hypothetical protein